MPKEFRNIIQFAGINKWCVLVAWWCHVFQHNVLTANFQDFRFFFVRVKALAGRWDLLSLLDGAPRARAKILWKPAVTFIRMQFRSLILNFKVFLKTDFYAKQPTQARPYWFLWVRKEKNLFKHIINILRVSSTAPHVSHIEIPLKTLSPSNLTLPIPRPQIKL